MNAKINMRVRQPSTGHVGTVLSVKPRKRPPAALVLFDGESHVDAVWVEDSKLEQIGVQR